MVEDEFRHLVALEGRIAENDPQTRTRSSRLLLQLWKKDDMGVKEAAMLLLYVLVLSCLLSILITLYVSQVYEHDFFLAVALFLGVFFVVAGIFSMCFFPFFRALLFS